jgi:hypothetical protein
MRKDSNMMDMIVFWVAMVMWLILIGMIAGGWIR